MYLIFYSSQSKSLTWYQKIFWGYLFGWKNLLTFHCLTIKFHKCHHTSVHEQRNSNFRPLEIAEVPAPILAVFAVDDLHWSWSGLLSAVVGHESKFTASRGKTNKVSSNAWIGRQVAHCVETALFTFLRLLMALKWDTTGVRKSARSADF